MKLNCHCGAVQIEVARAPESVTSCNCSLCNRYGALWGYFEPDDVSVACDGAGLARYSWGDKNIHFCRCNQCGCVTHYESSDTVENPKTAVNFRMAEPSVIESIKVRRFDGADTWAFLD